MKIRLLSMALLASNVAGAATSVDGWYTSLFGGYTYIQDNINTYNNGVFLNDVGYNGGYNAGGRVGYQSNPLRYELEYTHIQASTSHFAVNYVRPYQVDGSTSANLFMVNAYYDFPNMLPAISPFLGVGLGYSYLQTSLSTTGPSAATYLSAHEGAFAYQGTAGITYNFAENYAVNLAYRYVATNKIDTFGRSYQAQLASAGAIYHFDGGTYLK
ncbi:outer membrane protein [Legionella sp. km772]|uniref:outer membrane protein n=1 Tax=Legionella sp. km772 TaxID=2498111 RepID=UPI000F8E9C98|nr:P44/Msp2 family outer membrane protein [Legionella sp. km772]RUR06181.1 porin family protein [Legionella sp. km772]